MLALVVVSGWLSSPALSPYARRHRALYGETTAP